MTGPTNTNPATGGAEVNREGALVLLQPAWYLWLAPPANGRPWIALLLTLPPLLLPLTALRPNPRRALLWAGMNQLFQFVSLAL